MFSSDRLSQNALLEPLFAVYRKPLPPSAEVVACTTSCVMTKLSCATVIIQQEEHSASPAMAE
jgi:hypothetical protein